LQVEQVTKWPGRIAVRLFSFRQDARDAAPHPIGLVAPMLGSRRGGSILRPAPINGRTSMADSVYKVIELIGTSTESWEKAAAAAVGRASKTLRDLRVAEVVKLDLQLDATGNVEAYRAKLNVSFKFEGT
jgi:flavin-binding protein dodecin